VRVLPEIRGAFRKLAKKLTIKDVAYYFETTKPDHLQAADTSKAKRTVRKMEKWRSASRASTEFADYQRANSKS